MSGFLHDLVSILSNPYIAFIVFLALAFDFVNGFHDAANSIATVVSTRVLHPFTAVVWAAWWNFAAAWVFGVAVANTVAKWVHPEFVTPDVILAGLMGAIIWDLITWHFGLPTSSSHALLGGFAGAAIVYAQRLHNVVDVHKLTQTVIFIVVSPLVGLALGWLIILAIFWLFRNFAPARLDRHFRIIQLGTAAAFSLGHGTNDAQKTMGIIAALLYSSVWAGQQAAFAKGKAHFPFWIVLICHAAIALGTMAGGWKIVKTMGMKITKLRPYGGAAAESAAAVSLFMTAKLGVPVSTTHTIAGAIVGVGSVQRFSAVRWGVAGRVVYAWVLTIPMSALIAAVSFYALYLVRLPFTPVEFYKQGTKETKGTEGTQGTGKIGDSNRISQHARLFGRGSAKEIRLLSPIFPVNCAISPLVYSASIMHKPKNRSQESGVRSQNTGRRSLAHCMGAPLRSPDG
jgi:PiT family inorganic phosphate transporter